MTARQATGNTREATTATATPRSPGTRRLSALRWAEDTLPVASNSANPATAPVSRIESRTQVRSLPAVLALRHCSTTGRRSVFQDARTTDASPPAVAAAATAHEIAGSPTGVPARNKDRPSNQVALQPARAPNGNDATMTATGSDRPKAVVRIRP